MVAIAVGLRSPSFKCPNSPCTWGGWFPVGLNAFSHVNNLKTDCRLYAQHNSKGLTDTATKEYDNIALPVYRAYGQKTDDTEKEKDKLSLTDMTCGMNGHP